MLIKRKLYKKYLDLAKEQFDNSDPSKNNSKYVSEHRKMYLINALILIELAMESFINEFGYRFVINYEYLERISIKNRLVILPKIAKVNPKELIFETDQLYKDLNQLIKYRNVFVHRDSEEKIEKVFDHVDHSLVSKFYSAVLELMKKYDSHFNIFDQSENYLEGLPKTWV